MNTISGSQEGAASYVTSGGISVNRTITTVPLPGALDEVIASLDRERGVVLSSSFEYPGRYKRWDIGFARPPVAIVARGRSFSVEALSPRGRPLLSAIAAALALSKDVASVREDGDTVVGEALTPTEMFLEEERSRQPSVFSVLRTIIDLFRSDQDRHLGLYGAFGYDLAFQFEPISLRAQRGAARDLVLYLPDDMVVIDHQREHAERRRYVLEVPAARAVETRTELTRETPMFLPSLASPERQGVEVPACDHAPGEFVATVRTARESFARGDLFEVTPSQVFRRRCETKPSRLFERLRATNPAPYGFLANLGEGEHLVGASPEMYVRVTGGRVETCPIAGTIARGRDAVGDAAQIERLLTSRKDESELTMCTDVDRNDKSRVCKPGSIRILGRRQIEVYSRLVHTVDHIEGTLRDGFDALDAFLAHAWAVTVTGAPKTAAMQFIEDHERSPRAWYGGAVGLLGFDGNINTGLTLRTIRLRDGIAEVRVGATLLYDSDPQEEERETHLKASALLHVLAEEPPAPPSDAGGGGPRRQGGGRVRGPGEGRRVLLVDHQDSFVHTLGDYFRQTGAEVTTLRSGFRVSELDARAPHLVVLSPGPGRPSDFGLSRTIDAVVARRIPCFGVCLGLQGMVEYFGGALGVLPRPMHGQASAVHLLPRTGTRSAHEADGPANADIPDIFDGLPAQMTVGRYHSLYAVRERFPPCLTIRAETEDGVIMAIQHAELPMAAVQFHPESVMTQADGYGLRLITNVAATLR